MNSVAIELRSTVYISNNPACRRTGVVISHGQMLATTEIVGALDLRNSRSGYGASRHSGGEESEHVFDLMAGDSSSLTRLLPNV